MKRNDEVIAADTQIPSRNNSTLKKIFDISFFNLPEELLEQHVGAVVQQDKQLLL